MLLVNGWKHRTYLTHISKSEEAFASVYQLIEQAAGLRWVEKIRRIIIRNRCMSQAKQKSVDRDRDEIDLGRLFGELIDHRKLIIPSSYCVIYFICSCLCAFCYTNISSGCFAQVEQKQGNAILVI